MFKSSDHVSVELYEHLVSTHELGHEGDHGKDHWLRVLRNARLLADATGASPKVVELFALIHDSRRENEGYDPEHGWRAADHAATLRGSWFEVTDAEMDRLAYACRHHADGLTEAEDVTVLACWDADRLDLGRVGIRPDPARLCTDFAKRPDVIEEAYRRSRQHR